MKVCKDHQLELASWLVEIFLETDNIIDKLIKCNQVMIERESKLLLGFIKNIDHYYVHFDQ